MTMDSNTFYTLIAGNKIPLMGLGTSEMGNVEVVVYHSIKDGARLIDIAAMYGNEDLERFYFQYQTEALPSGESVQSFCKRNNVPYNIFSKWYKDTRKRIVEVSVEGRPSAVSSPDSPVPDATPAQPQAVLRIMVDIDKLQRRYAK